VHGNAARINAGNRSAGKRGSVAVAAGGVAWRRHPRDVGVVVVGRKLARLHHLFDLLLPVRLEAVELLVGIELLVVQAVPPRVLFKLLPLSLRQELFVRNHHVLVFVRLLEDMLPHPLHLLLALLHVVLWVVGVVGLVQLLLEQSLYLVFVPLAVTIQVVHCKEGLGIPILCVHVILVLPDLLELVFGHGVVHLLVHAVLGLHLLHLLLHVFASLRVIDGVEPMFFLKLLLHLVLLKLFAPLVIRLL